MTRPVTLLVGPEYKAGDVLEFQGNYYTATEDSTYIDAATQRFAEEVNDQHMMTGWHTNVHPATDAEKVEFLAEQERNSPEAQASAFKPGDRVEAKIYGWKGTVRGIRGAYVVIQKDGSDKTTERMVSSITRL